MSRSLKRRIRRSREILQNPWAHLNDGGSCDGVVPRESWELADARSALENQFAYLNGDGTYGNSPRSVEQASKPAFIKVSDLLDGRTRGRAFTRYDVEAIARNLHKKLWQKRKDLLARSEITPLDLVDPTLALQSLGYRVKVEESLGQYYGGRDSFEVAGLFDRDRAEVKISRHFPVRSRNFTAAHELGHAILHLESGLHRDRAPDGPVSGPKDHKEVEADMFASCFLMPEKMVRQAFMQRYLSERFEVNEATAFALISKGVGELRKKCPVRRDLARTLAQGEYFNGVHFKSLAEQFRVSVEAMAIRLEELELITERFSR